MEGIKKYGIILNAQPTLLPEIPQLIDDYGEELRKFAMPVKTWIDQGMDATRGVEVVDAEREGGLPQLANSSKKTEKW